MGTGNTGTGNTGKGNIDTGNMGTGNMGKGNIDTGNMGTGNMGTSNTTRNPYDTQAAAGHPPTAGTMPGTHQKSGAHTGPTFVAAPPPGQPHSDQGLSNIADPAEPRFADPADPHFAPSTGQKVSARNILSIV